MKIHPDWHFDPFGKFDTCPACLGSVQPTVAHEQVNFVCTSCGCCWHLFLGYLSLIDPRTCPRCALSPLCSVAAYLDCVADGHPDQADARQRDADQPALHGK